MQSIRRAFLAIAAFLACAVPAAAQMASDSTTSGSSLILVWVWILVAGVIIFIVGTSMGVKSGKR